MADGHVAQAKLCGAINYLTDGIADAAIFANGGSDLRREWALRAIAHAESYIEDAKACLQPNDRLLPTDKGMEREAERETGE